MIYVNGNLLLRFLNQVANLLKINKNSIGKMLKSSKDL